MFIDRVYTDMLNIVFFGWETYIIYYSKYIKTIVYTLT